LKKMYCSCTQKMYSNIKRQNCFQHW